MRYLQGTKNYMLFYKHGDNLEVVEYSKWNFFRYQDFRKSTLGFVFMLANGAISWKSTKYMIVASSIMKA